MKDLSGRKEKAMVMTIPKGHKLDHVDPVTGKPVYVPIKPLSLVDTLKLIRKADFLFGFPKNDNGLELIARKFMGITGSDKERSEWLVERIIDGCERFPTPIEIRRIYENHYIPADGVFSREVDNFDMMK